MIQIAELFHLDEPDKIALARQIGITHAIVKVLPNLTGMPPGEYGGFLAQVRDDLANAGLVFAGVESHPVPAEKIKLGLPGRDEEIENYIAVIRALSQTGVPLLCYNWMAGLGWYRTRTDVPGRGDALVSEFDLQAAEAEGLTEFGIVPEERIWRNLEYFLDAVLPVAEEAGVRMALHPDDPPVSPLRGIGRILTSAESFRRVLNYRPGPMNGVTFCQANFRLMGEDIEALVHEWSGKIFFVHLRDIEGTRERFHEVFHDESPTDLTRMLRIYHEAGFSGPMRPDHAPTLHGERNHRPGYAMGGKMLAVGYMKGAMDALGIPYSRNKAPHPAVTRKTT